MDYVRHCALCDVFLTSQSVSRLHFNGKKHRRMDEIEQKRKDLQSRSIFMHGYPAKTVSRSDILDYFSGKFGPVQNLQMDSGKGTWAIIEFTKSEIVDEILRGKKVEINGQKIAVKPRLLTSHSTHSKNDPTADAATSQISVDSSVNLDELISYCSSEFDCMRKLADTFRISSENLTARRILCSDLKSTLDKYFAFDFSLELFGSSVNGFGSLQSDVDLTIIFDRGTLNSFQSIRASALLMNCQVDDLAFEHRILLAEFEQLQTSERYALLRKFLSANGNVSEIEYIKGNRCPLLKFLYTTENDKIKFQCELCLNNRLGLNNSKYLAFLTANFPNLAVYGQVLRYWAHVRKAVDSSVHSLNHYTLLLMFISYLQSLNLLPPVQPEQRTQIASDEHRDELIDGWNCRFSRDISSYANEKIDNASFDGFFDFLSSTNWANTVFLPRYGKIVKVDDFLRNHLLEIENAYIHRGEKLEKDAAPRRQDYAHILFRFSKLNVQDPFVLNHNPAAKVSPVLVKSLKIAAKFRVNIANDCPFLEHLKRPVVVEKSEKSSVFSTQMGFTQTNLVANFAMFVHPTNEDFLCLGLRWLTNFRDHFIQNTFTNVCRILSEFLFFELSEVKETVDSGTCDEVDMLVASACGHSSPVAKKPKNDPCHSNDFVEKWAVYDCSAYSPTWCNRNLKNYAHDLNFLAKTDKFEREIEISRRIRDNFANNQLKSFRISDKWMEQEMSVDSKGEESEKICPKKRANFSNYHKFQPGKSPLLTFRLKLTSKFDHVTGDYGILMEFACSEQSFNKNFKLFCQFFQSYFRKWRCALCGND